MSDHALFHILASIVLIAFVITLILTWLERQPIGTKNRSYTVDFVAGGRKVLLAENAYIEDGFMWFLDVNGKDVACFRPEHIASFEVTAPQPATSN